MHKVRCSDDELQKGLSASGGGEPLLFNIFKRVLRYICIVRIISAGARDLAVRTDPNETLFP